MGAAINGVSGLVPKNTGVGNTGLNYNTLSSMSGAGTPVDYHVAKVDQQNFKGLGDALGMGGGNAGGVGNSPSPVMPDIQSPVTPGQLTNGQAGVTNSIASQNALLAALSGQGGPAAQTQALGNINNLGGQLAGANGVGTQVNATGQQQNLNSGLTGLNGLGAQGAAMGGQGTLNNQLAGVGGTNLLNSAAGSQLGLNSQLGNAGGVGAQQSAISGLGSLLGQQQNTADQYQNIANGTGPNPAQAALNQSTGQNVANQAALMAGQRGAGANVGLLARQAAQQGAATQQQAVGQGATMQAQQQLAGLSGLSGAQQAMGATNQGIGALGAGLVGQQQAGVGQLGNLGTSVVNQQQTGLGQQFGQGSGVTGQLQTGIGQQFGQGATTTGQQQANNAQGAGVATNMVNQQMGQGQNIAGNVLANQGQNLGAAGQFNTGIVSGQGNVNTANTAMNVESMKGRQGITGGLLNAGGGALAGLLGGGGAAAAGEGGGALAGADAAELGTIAATAAKGGYVQKMAAGGYPGVQAPFVQSPTVAPLTGPSQNGPASSFGQFMQGLNATLEPTKTASLAPGNIPGAARGGSAHDFRSGGKVKAHGGNEKATKPGNSYTNDKVKALLSEGEVVIPRSIMLSKDPIRGSADFVRKVMAKRGKR